MDAAYINIKQNQCVSLLEVLTSFGVQDKKVAVKTVHLFDNIDSKQVIWYNTTEALAGSRAIRVCS